MTSAEFINPKQAPVQLEESTLLALKVYSSLKEKITRLQRMKSEIQQELDVNCASINMLKSNIFTYVVCIDHVKYYVPYTNLDKANQLKKVLIQKGIDEADVTVEYSNDFGNVDRVNEFETFDQSDVDIFFNDWKKAKGKSN